MPPPLSNREAVPDMPNPAGIEDIEFIEYTAHRPQAPGQALDQGAWEVPSHAQTMEPHTPAIHGPGWQPLLQRARQSALWLRNDAPRRPVPLPEKP